MNNDQEFAAFQKQYQNVPGLEIVELMPVVGRDPLQSLRDGIDKIRAADPAHPHCDGLVLSGHHNGEWFGARTNGGLELSALEDLKCDPKYQPFFDGVDALWMQGCNTMDEDTGAPIEAPSSAPRSPAGGTPQHRSRADYNVSERYKALFENSTQYGWQGIAPGVGSDSPDSMILFMEGFARDPEDQNALVAALKSSSRFAGASSSDIAAALPEIFGECRDLQAAWENPQEARYGRASNPRVSQDYRRPKASLPLSSTTSRPAPVCAIKNNSIPTPQVMAALGASDQNLEASLPALTEELKQVMALPPDAIVNAQDANGVTFPLKRDSYIKKWRDALRTDGRAIAYLKEKARSPDTSPADRIQALTMLETLTGATMPASDQQAIAQTLDQGLQGKGSATTDQDLLDQLRLVDIADQQGLMTPARWEQFATSLAGVPVSSSPALREIASRGVAKLVENGGLPKTGLPPSLQPLATAPGRAAALPPPQVTTPPAPTSAPQATIGAPSSSTRVTPATPAPETPASSTPQTPAKLTPPIPKSPPSAGGNSKPKISPAPAKTSPAMGGVCRSRPEFEFNGFTNFKSAVPSSAKCACDSRGCGNTFFCRSPSKPPFATDSCMIAQQKQYAQIGKHLGNAPSSCPRGCIIEHVCTYNSWSQRYIWPHQKYGDWFCAGLESKTSCEAYRSCRWLP